MYNLVMKKLTKKLISALLIITTILSYCPLYSFANNVEEDDDIDKINFTVRWKSNKETEEGKTSDSFGIEYSIAFNQVQTGFQNVSLSIVTDAVEGVSDYITSKNGFTNSGSNYAFINYGNQQSGTFIESDASISFGNENAQLNRAVTFRLEGTYTDPKTKDKVNFVKEKTLNAIVTPRDKIRGYMAELATDTNRNNIRANRIDLGKNAYGLSKGWYAEGVNSRYYLKISSFYHTQKLELRITINRYNKDNENKLSEGYAIDWGGLDKELGQPNEISNEDGSVTYVFSKGNDSNILNEAETFRIDKEYYITVDYKTLNTNPETVNEGLQSRTRIDFKAELNTTGFSTKEVWGQEKEVNKINKNLKVVDDRQVGLCQYFSGTHAWIAVSNKNAGINDKGYLTDEILQDLIKNRTADIQLNTEMSITVGDIDTREGTIHIDKPNLKYISDSGETISKELTENQIRMKSIKEGDVPFKDKISNIDNSSIDGTYTIDNGTNINSLNLVLEDFLNDVADEYDIPRNNWSYYGKQINFSGYTFEYTLNVDELGLTDTEIANILSINFSTSTSGSDYLMGGELSSITKPIQTTENKYSYMELELGDGTKDYVFNTNVNKVNEEESKTLRLKMYRNYKVIDSDEEDVKNYVVNENPIFYVSLPSGFKYDLSERGLKLSITNNDNIQINESEVNKIRVNGEDYLVIPCIGTYNSNVDGEIDITITYKRTLKNNDPGTYKINAFMLTDNMNYTNPQKNINEFEKNGEIPGEIFNSYARFNVMGNKELSARTALIVGGNRIQPNTSDSVIDETEKECPIIIESGNSVTIESSIKASDMGVKNVSIISRTPFENSSYIHNESEKLIEEGYNLPDSFYEKYENNIKGNEQGSAVKQLTMENIRDIQVYKTTANNQQRSLSKGEYTVYFSNEENANFESDSFVEYEEGVSELSQARNIKVVFNNQLNAGEVYRLKYNVTMPDKTGMVGTTTAAQYTFISSDTPGKLYSAASYMINGSEKGNLEIQKKFKYYNNGTAPTGTSLSGIEFKLRQYNEVTKEYSFVQDSEGNDLVATTNESGIAKFNNIPSGDYYVYETTKFDNYGELEGITAVTIERATTTKYTAINGPKYGNIIVHKNWSSAKDTQGKVRFTVNRMADANENLDFGTKIITTDENDIAKLEHVPYGRYTITETSGATGWVCRSNPKEVTLDKEELNIGFDNEPGKASLQIVKTVPEGEVVYGLGFHITGRGAISYTDTDGNIVNTNTDMHITVNNTGASPENVKYEFESNSKVTITISNLYLGLYTVEEENIPKIPNTDIDKYSAAKGSAILDETNYYNSTPSVISLANNYKMGYIEINKTAKLKSGDEYTDIGDLSGFKVRISGTSYYGNEVNTVITLDENGYGLGKFEIGKYTITEEPQEGYTTYYGENATASTTPPEIEIIENRIIRQSLYNEHTGVGYVRVEKSLEGVTDPQTVVNCGIQFKVVGQNVAGQRVNEVIAINKIDAEKNVAYGISGPISSGGEYELQEVEDTVPDYYEAIEPMAVEIKTTNTQESPKVIMAVNNRTLGNLEIVTTTEPEGGPLTGITYKVTEVKINNNGTYEKVGETKNVIGSNELVNPSYAKLIDIYAGYYLVEQDVIPEGWIKDVKQIVEVPSYNTGYANFEITEKKKLQKNRVVVNKVIVDENGEELKGEELENAINKAKLNQNESFEVKLTNVETNKVYYVFTSVDKPGVIQGLDVGTYKVEEIYKPKYITEGYYKNIEIKPSEVVGLSENIESKFVQEKIADTNNEYLFTIDGEGKNVESVSLTIKNKINTEFGFGGKEKIDNLGKTKVEEEEITLVTKAVIYVVDENNNSISGVKFQLINSEGKVVNLNDIGSTFEIANRKLIINGLPTGAYTLKCVEYPTGYLKPNDKTIIVYSDATQVSRVEIQKNIPRGSLTLSTTYTTDKGETKYTSRSKYKVVNKETGELVKFVRTATGDYRKTNLEDASAVIVLKSGPVEVEGIETGKYEVGIVDVTKGYGIQSKLPEAVEVEQNQSKEVSVEVISKNIVGIGASSVSTMYLDESGDLYIKGKNEGNVLGKEDSSYYTSKFEKIEFPTDTIKIQKFIISYNSVIAIDTEGRVWEWGYDATGTSSRNITSPECLTESGVLYEEYHNNETKFIDIAIGNTGTTILILDNKGRVWARGDYVGDGTSNKKTEITEPIAALKDVFITKLATLCTGNYSNLGAIDSEGKVWIWGNYGTVQGNQTATASYVPVCISDTTDLKNTIIKDLVITTNYAMALDESGNIWLWGSSNVIEANMLRGAKIVPTKVDSSFFGGAKIKKITGNNFISDANNGIAAVVDEYGRVWTWGVGPTGQLGNGATSGGSGVPICISDEPSEPLYQVQIKDIIISDGRYNGNFGMNAHVIAVDTNNKLWTWGASSYYGEAGDYGSAPIGAPHIINNGYNEHLEYNLKFSKIFVNNYLSDREAYFAIDEYGKLWVWGYNYNRQTGISTSQSDIENPIVLDIPGKVKQVSSFNAKTIILGEGNRVFISGDGYLGNGQKASGYSSNGIAVTEITNNIPTDIGEIIDIVVSTGTYAILDSEGKVYTWGSYPGRAENKLIIQNMSDGVLKDKKIVKMTRNRYDDIVLLSESGKIYTFGTSHSTITEINSDANFVDIKNSTAIDSNGNIWLIDCTNSIVLRNIASDVHNPMYKYYQADSSYGITKLYQGKAQGCTIAKDTNGVYWNIPEYYSSTLDITKMNIEIENIVDLATDIVIDSYGQLWEITSDGMINMATPDKNIMYNVKIKNIISDQLVEDENGAQYEFRDDSITKKEKQTTLEEYAEKTLGVKIVNSVDGYSKDNAAYSSPVKYFIDEKGKLWKGYTTSSDLEKTICLSDTNEQLRNKHNENAEFKIEKIYSNNIGGSNYIYFAIDNTGKVWSWGYNKNAECGNGTGDEISEPVCISDGSGTELNNKYKTNENFKIEEIYCFGYTNFALDNTGKIWSWGHNGVGQCGNGTTSSYVIRPVCISDISGTELYNKYVGDTEFRIEAITQKSEYCYFAIDNTGKLWAWGQNKYGECGDGTTSVIKNPTCIRNIPEININNLEFIGSGSSLKIALKDNSGSLWLWGNNSDGTLGNGTTDRITTPYNISENMLGGKAIKEYNLIYGYILCEDGTIYLSGTWHMQNKFISNVNWTEIGKCEGANDIRRCYYNNQYYYLVTGENKVWTFGYNSRGQCGTGTTSSTVITTPTLISEEFTVLDTIPINNGAFCVIDTNGYEWKWGIENGSSTPIRPTRTDRIIQIINNIYGEVTNDNINTLVKNANNSNTNVIVANGKLWIGKGFDYVCQNTISWSILNNVEIVDASEHKALDANGNLYVWNAKTGLGDAFMTPTCITTMETRKDNSIKSNNIINVPKTNNLYGVKVKQLVNDKFVIDENDNVWYFALNGEAVNLTKEHIGDENPLYNKEIKRIINSSYVETTDNKVWYIGGTYPAYVLSTPATECEYIYENYSEGYEHYVALDKNGKIWTGGVNEYGILGNGKYTTNKESICLNDMEGTELYNENTKFTKVCRGISYNSIIAIDTNGKVWTWGGNSRNGTGKSEYIKTPMCLTNIEGTSLYNAYNNDSIKIVEIDMGDYNGSYRTYSNFEDSNGDNWILNTSTNLLEKGSRIPSYATGALLNAYEEDPNFDIIKQISSGVYIVLGNNGKLYYKPGYADEEYIEWDRLNSVKEIYVTTSGKSGSYTSYYACAYCEDGEMSTIQVQLYNGNFRNIYIYSPSASNIIKIIQTSSGTLALNESGKIYASGYLGDSGYTNSTNYGIKCLSTLSDYTLYNKNIVDIDKIGNTYTATDSEGNLYAWKGLTNSNTPVLLDMYDSIVQKIYGEVNAENRKATIQYVQQGYFTIGNELYKVVGTNYGKVDYQAKYINGIGKITNVVGEYEVQTEDGKIYRVVPTGVDSYSIGQAEEVTPFTTSEPDATILEGINVVKQTLHKALDDKGNLYVWDEYTGLDKYDTSQGVVSITQEEYSVEPVYSNSNGWSAVRNQF